MRMCVSSMCALLMSVCVYVCMCALLMSVYVYVYACMSVCVYVCFVDVCVCVPKQVLCVVSRRWSC